VKPGLSPESQKLENEEEEEEEEKGNTKAVI
jgi:hypothetical protein